MKIATRKCATCGKDFKPKDNLKAGKYCSHACYWADMSNRKGKETSAWKEKVSYAGIHKWVNREFGKPKYCEFCNSVIKKKYQWANISNLYLRDINDWMRLCQECHSKWDRLAQKKWITQKGTKKKGLYGIDFDGTICLSKKENFDNALPVKGARRVLKKLLNDGYNCYILTAREPKDWRFIAKWMFKNGFAGMPIHNRKLKETRMYFDDRAIRFISWQDIRKYIN